MLKLITMDTVSVILCKQYELDGPRGKWNPLLLSVNQLTSDSESEEPNPLSLDSASLHEHGLSKRTDWRLLKGMSASETELIEKLGDDIMKKHWLDKDTMWYTANRCQVVGCRLFYTMQQRSQWLSWLDYQWANFTKLVGVTLWGDWITFVSLVKLRQHQIKVCCYWVIVQQYSTLLCSINTRYILFKFF